MGSTILYGPSTKQQEVSNIQSFNCKRKYLSPFFASVELAALSSFVVQKHLLVYESRKPAYTNFACEQKSLRQTQNKLRG